MRRELSNLSGANQHFLFTENRLAAIHLGHDNPFVGLAIAPDIMTAQSFGFKLALDQLSIGAAKKSTDFSVIPQLPQSTSDDHTFAANHPINIASTYHAANCQLW